MNSIKFGIEIETHIPALSPISVGRYHAGDLCPQLPMSAGGKLWKCERDGSIDYPAGRQAAELVSPVLQGTDGVRNVVKAVAKLKELDAKVNESCGIHVTVEWNGDQAALARLIHLVGNFETAFYGSTGTKKRENGRYCKKLKTYGTPELARSAASRDRYHVLNLTHVANGQNRVEFRCFSSSLNTGKIVGWIMMCLAVTEVALNGKIRPFDHSQPNETATEAVERFLKTMCWTGGVGKNHDRAKGNVYTLEKTTEGLPSRKFVHNELRRMAAKYDLSVVPR